MSAAAQTAGRPSREALARAAAWANSIVGRRYPREGEPADGPETFNCWGVARSAALALHGCELPPGPISGLVDQMRANGIWRASRRVSEPVHGALGFTSITAAPRHVVVYLANDRGVVVHALEGHGVVCWPQRQLETYGFLRAVWYLPAGPDGAAPAVEAA